MFYDAYGVDLCHVCHVRSLLEYAGVDESLDGASLAES